MSILTEGGHISDPYRAFISVSRYSRWLEEENRRETWTETVDRYISFMRTHADIKYPGAIEKTFWDEATDAILNHKVMPSMRCLMTAGPALQRENLAGYNCSFIAIDDARAFDEALYILMNGVGLGFSVEKEHVSKLPTVNEHFEQTGSTIVVADSKAGWARGFRELIAMLYAGQIPVIDISNVRPAGERLKTFGGRASGPQSLIDLFDFTIGIFKNAAGRRLTSLEAHDIMCKVGEVVVVGGVRRCFGDYTEISTHRGVVLGKDIAVGDMIISGGRKARVSAKVDSGKQQTIIVKHQYGQSEMTPNHRIAVFNSVNTYEFKEAGSLVSGDRLVWDLAGYDGEIQSLPVPSYTGHFNAKPFDIPEILDTDTAWLIGLVHGDGHIHIKGIEISGHEDEWATLERANSIFADKFGVSGTVAKDSHSGKGIRLRVNSTGLALWFAENIKNPNVPIKIPEFIKSAQKDVRAAYLAGVLDSDGRIRSDGGIDQATTIYRKFASDLSGLLRSLGIPSVIQTFSAQRRRDNGENAQDFWTISVATRTGADMYLSVVGEYSERDIPVRTKNTGDFTYPAEWKISFKSRNTTRQWAVDNNIVSADYPFAPVQVESVDLGIIQQTWDIEVDDIHEFTADGLITHNSALISQSDLHDYEMAKAKNGAWWENNQQRALSNNSAVYYKKPSIGEFLQEWGNLYESKSGERGIINMQGLRGSDLAPRRDLSKIAGLNPCLPADTWVMTDFGPRQIGDIVEHKTNLMLDGQMYDSTGFYYTGTKRVYKMTLDNGMSVRATDNHQILTESGWKELKDITISDRVRLSQNEGHSWLGAGTDSEGYIIGLLVGDGTFGQNACIDVWESSESIMAHAVSAMENIGISAEFNLCTQVGNEKKWRATSRQLTDLALKFGVTRGNKEVTKQIQEASSQFYEGFLRGYFDADGSAQGGRNKGQSVRLWSTSKNNLDGVQKMLSRLGIMSKIYFDRVPAGKRLLPDSNRNLAFYDCKAGHELIISRQAIAKFAERIGFSDNDKQDKLKAMLSGVRELYKNSEFSAVSGVEADGIEDVYDAAVPEVSAFDANGIYVHNCAEILLRSKQLCNLTEVVVEADDTLQDLCKKVEIATILGTIQSSLTDFKYLRKIWRDNCEEERLLGVSLTGQMGHKVLNGSEGLDALKSFLQMMREEAVQTNDKFAKKMGINLSTAITTVKPSGTVSQLTASSSGMHPWHNDYYIRSVRADNKDPLTEFMKDVGIPNEPDVTKPNSTTVFYFPQKAPKDALTRNDLTAIEHLNLWKAYKIHWTEHNPSITISVREHEWIEVANWVYENWEYIGGISFLPYSEHSYKQAPYQDCDITTYKQFAADMPKVIDWSMLSAYEHEDTTTGVQSLSCTSSNCELVSIGNV